MVFELPQELPNDLSLEKLENIRKISLGIWPSAHSSLKKLSFGNSS